MIIEILGVEGCPNCTELVRETINILSRIQVSAYVEKITDQKVIGSYGPGVVPGFVLNGKLKAGGRRPSAAEILQWIKEEKM